METDPDLTSMRRFLRELICAGINIYKIYWRCNSSPQPAFSISKVLTGNQDWPMNSCRQETSQDSCFSSDQASLREAWNKKVHFFPTSFYMATGLRKRLDYATANWEMYGAGAPKTNKGCRSPDFRNEFAFWRHKTENVPFHWLNPTMLHMLFAEKNWEKICWDIFQMESIIKPRRCKIK